MAKPLSILCVHGIGHGDIDPDLEGSWSKAICDGLVAWNPDLQGAITCDFLKYDSLFEQAPLDSTSYAQAFAELLASGVIHGIGDLQRDGCLTGPGILARVPFGNS